jgi:F420-0:gamma-glutamyl ligase
MSTKALSSALLSRWRGASAVVNADGIGSPWRMGVVTVAIGASGLPALMDRRGAHDRDGRQLKVTLIAAVDMIASAAGLTIGESDSAAVDRASIALAHLADRLTAKGCCRQGMMATNR